MPIKKKVPQQTEEVKAILPGEETTKQSSPKKGASSKKKTPPKKAEEPKKKTTSQNIEEVLNDPLDIDKIKEEEGSIDEEGFTHVTKVRQEALPREWQTLTRRQELFCQLYATDKEFFGNGVQAYLEIYDIDRSKPNWYQTACSCTSQLLSNSKVCNRINDLLSEFGLNDQYVDKQLLFLINQHEDKGSKLWAIREYNKLKKRIDDRLNINIPDVITVKVPE